MADYERTLFMCRETYVYKIPPRATSKGHKAADWDLNAWVWQGRLRVIGLGQQCLVRLEDGNTGDLFAMCRYNKNDNSVEPVLDSSRYFVIRIENERGQHTFIGIGFQERTTAFDFNVVLQDFEKHINAEKDAAKRLEEWEKQPKKDFSLKEGQTISIKIGGNASTSSSKPAAPNATGGFGLPPPPGGSRVVPPPAASGFAPPPGKKSPFDDFDDFQAPQSNSNGNPNSGSGGFGGWTTF